MKCGRAETANRNALVLENYVLLKEFSEKRSSLTARGPSAVWVWPRAYFQEEEAEVSVLKTPRYLEFSGREANAKFLIDVLPTMKLNNEWIAIQHTAKHSNFPHTLIPKLNSQLLQMSNYPDRDSKTPQNLGRHLHTAVHYCAKIFLLALRSNVGHGLLILEVSRSRTTMYDGR